MPQEVTLWWSALSSLGQSVVVVSGAVAVYLVVRLVILRGLARLAASTENDMDDRLVHFGRRFFGLALLLATVALVLRVHDIEISPLLAGAGIAGVALGFAAKETIADVLAGIFLIADRPLRIGDRVKIEHIGKHWGAWGDVVDIGLRRTTIRNTDGVMVNYPNAVLAGSVITNFSFEGNAVRTRVRFGVDWSVDLDLVKRVTTAAIESVDGVRPGSTSLVVRSLWDDTRGNLLPGILIEGRYMIEDVRRRTRLRSDVLTAIQATLRKHDVRMPMTRLATAPTYPDD